MVDWYRVMVYQFHDYVLHVDRRELWRGKQGIAIEPKVFQVLLYLVENRGRVITKAELLDHCWPDTFVSESALTRCLTRLRKALQGVSPQPVIKTLPRQGYRFVAEVIVQPHDTEFHTSYPQPVLAASPLAHSSVPVAPPTPLDTPQMSEPTRHDFEAAPERTPLSPVAERRQLTVMFCDVVEAASLAGQLDPEDYRDVMLRYQATCTAIIERYDGHIAQYLGNGLLVYFGYPMAHEDDAQRAGHTGLSIVDAMERLNLQLEREYGIRLAVRIGIHTGLVVVGEMGGGPQHGSLALGAVPNLAAQIQGLASPNGVLMSALTKALAEGYFVWQPAGAHAVSGMSEPVPLYQALQASGAQHRFDTAHPGALTPLVGRELELGLLLERWGHVREGDGHVVILSGEAGIGKSRLVLAVKSHIADRAVVL
jgi:class 3 adenylate cyclase/DNA-binding winged helix-turn-helix (wHTH) protein